MNIDEAQKIYDLELPNEMCPDCHEYEDDCDCSIICTEEE